VKQRGRERASDQAIVALARVLGEPQIERFVEGPIDVRHVQSEANNRRGERHRLSLERIAGAGKATATSRPSGVAAPAATPYRLGMPDEATLRSDFDQFDTDNNGTIDKAEFASLLEFLGEGFSKEQTQLAFQAIDSDGSGQIEFDEFRQWWSEYEED
jgi:hypothetical protein